MPATLTKSGWLNAPDFDAARRTLVASSHFGFSIISASMFGVYALVGLWQGAPALTIAVEAFTCGALLVLRMLARSARIPVRYANAVLAAFIVAFLGSYVVAVLQAPASFTSPGFLVLVVAPGLLLVSWRAVVVSTGAIFLAWSVTGYVLHAPLAYGFFQTILPGLTLSFVIHFLRIRSYRQHYVLHQAERQHADALVASESRWRALVANLPGSLTILDRRGKLGSMGPFPQTGGAKGHLEFDLAKLSPSDRERLDGYLDSIFERGESFTFEMASRAEAAEVWHSITAGPIHQGEHITGAIFLGTDISQRRQDEERLRHADKLSSLGTLVAGVAHEINNPLTYVRGSIEMNSMDLEAIAAKTEDAALKENLRAVLASQDTVMRGIDRIEHITQSLKRVARSNRGERRTEDVNVLVDSIVTVVGARVEDKAVLEMRLDATRTVEVDASEMSQVLLNLILNAVDAVEGCPDPRVLISTLDSADGGTQIEVSDNGVGIHDDARALIFTPFKTTKPNGTGLGLSISHRIVEDHGGSLTFDSRPGQGTTFRVRLPATDEGRVPSREVDARGAAPVFEAET